MRTILVTAALVGLASCSQTSPSAALASATGINFELECDAASTATSAQMHCVRTDTRSGDIVVVDYMRLPSSNGPTASGSTAPGRFTTRCAAPGMDTRADFYCVRMNTETGELLLVNLTKVAVFPPRTQ